MNQKLYDLLTVTIPKLLPAVCLLSFIVLEEIWICCLVATFCFGYLYIAQVFVEQSRQWYSSPYLMVTILCAILTWLEYSYQIIGRFLQ